MDPAALGNLLSGLAGAVIGALVGAVAATKVAERQITADRNLQRRDELRALIAQFWGACDALWVAQQDLGWAIVSMQIDRQAEARENAKLNRESRQQALADIAASLRECRQSIALLKLLYPDLVESAEALIHASRDFAPRPEGGDLGEKSEQARARALTAFEDAAKVQLELK